MKRISRHFTSEKARSHHQVHNLLRDITLAIGGVFYAYPVPDNAVWEVARSLDRIFRRAIPAGDSCCDINDEPLPNNSRGRRHPAIVELLRKLEVYGSRQPNVENTNA